MRGQKAVDLEALETLLVRFSQLLWTSRRFRRSTSTRCWPRRSASLALDARVLLRPADQPPEQRPRLAIHPYPNQYTAPFRLRDGREVTIRPIRPEDEPLIIALHAGHSEHTIRMRFFSLVKTLSRDSLIRLCHLDYDREMALVAVLHGGRRTASAGRVALLPQSGDGRRRSSPWWSATPTSDKGWDAI